MEINFCRRCGAKVEQKAEGVFLCAQGHHLYYKSFPAAAALLLNERNELLLTVRGIDPDKGMLDLPGGFCNWAERHEDAVRRELQEELGLGPEAYGPLTYLTEGVDIYTYENEDEPVLCVFFWARVTGELNITPGDDVVEVQWTVLTEVDVDKLPPKAHGVRGAIKALQEKLR